MYVSCFRDAYSNNLFLFKCIDGTTNFAHGYPSFAVSVGVLYRGNPAAASVVRSNMISFADSFGQ